MQCPNCGFDNRADARFCKQCGYALPSSAPPPTPAPAPPPAPSSAPALPLTVCPQCGAPLKAGARFCARCGQAVSEQPAAASAPAASQYATPQTVPPAPGTAAGPSPTFANSTQPGLAMPPSAPTRPRRRFPWLWLLIGGLLCLLLSAVLLVLLVLKPGQQTGTTPAPTLTTSPPALTPSQEAPATPSPMATQTPVSMPAKSTTAANEQLQVTLSLEQPSLPGTDSLTVTVTLTNLATVRLAGLTCELLGPLNPLLALPEAVPPELEPGGIRSLTFSAPAPLPVGTFPLKALVTYSVEEADPYRDALLTGPLTVTVSE